MRSVLEFYHPLGHQDSLVTEGMDLRLMSISESSNRQHTQCVFLILEYFYCIYQILQIYLLKSMEVL
jgi:aryl carrier-like protein